MALWEVAALDSCPSLTYGYFPSCPHLMNCQPM